MRIYLAGGEQLEQGAMIATVRAPSVLVSYFHCRGSASKSAQVAAVFQHATGRFVDSGAHSLRTAGGVTGRKGNSYKMPNLDEYQAEYIAWLQSMKKLRLIDNWVELDVGEVAGMKWIHMHRERFIKAGLGGGLINVWHSNHDWDYWLYLLREACMPGRSRYVAIEGHQPTRPPLEYMRFLHEAYRRGVRVHGFKMTKANDIQRWPFYSVDSTSWLSPVYAHAPVKLRTGGMMQGRRNGLEEGALQLGAGRRMLWRAPIPRRQTRAWRRDIFMVSIKAWIQCEKDMTALWLARGVDWDKAIAQPEVVDEQAASA